MCVQLSPYLAVINVYHTLIHLQYLILEVVLILIQGCGRLDLEANASYSTGSYFMRCIILSSDEEIHLVIYKLTHGLSHHATSMYASLFLFTIHLCCVEII